MQKFPALFLLLLVFFSCPSDDDNGTNTGDFQYTVSGSSSATVMGTNCRFGPSTGSSSFITMVSGVEVLTFNILLDPLVPGDYQVNAVFVNGVLQPSMPGDASGELQLGSSIAGNEKFFNTASGDGGRVTISSVNGDVLQGNFQVNMLELVGGTPGGEPQINIAGAFVANLQ